MFHQFVFRNRIIKNRFVSDSKTLVKLHLLQAPSLIRFINNISNPNFTLNYLIKSCGLSPELALKASKKVALKSKIEPDSVLSLFNTYGFSEPDISKLIVKRPKVLLANIDKTLKPRLDFFTSMGISGSTLGKIFSTNRNILTSSLENQIIPSTNFFKSLGCTASSIAVILCKCDWRFHNTESTMGANISILREHGVPHSNIMKFLLVNPQTLNFNFDRFGKMVVELKKMDISPSSMMFLHGLHVLMGTKKSTWDAKLALYRSYGWSEDEVLSLFKKQPSSMAASVKKITVALDFFMNSLKWTRSDVARKPPVILLSMEKRVIPRSHVLQILLSKHLISKEDMARAYLLTEDMFLKKFVVKYHCKVPNLVKVYQSKMGTQVLLVSSENGCKTDEILASHPSS